MPPPECVEALRSLCIAVRCIWRLLECMLSMHSDGRWSLCGSATGVLLMQCSERAVDLFKAYVALKAGQSMCMCMYACALSERDEIMRWVLVGE